MRDKTRRRFAQPGTPPSGLEVRQLRAFVALVEQGSVTAASRTLGLAQSTVSEALAALERALGTTVLQRRRRADHALLTPAGHALLPHARRVLAAVEETHVAIAAATNTGRATVEIVANESVNTYVLPDVLARMRDRWPNTRFSVAVSTCPGIRQGLDDGAFDVGLLLETSNRRTSADHPATSATPYADRRVVAPNVSLVVFGAHMNSLVSLAARAPARRSELAAFTVLLSDADGDFHTLVERFFKSEGVPGPRLQVIGSVEGVKRGVLADTRALGILPSYAIAEELRTGRVVRLSFRPPPPELRLEALLSRSRARHPSTDDLLAGIQRIFAADTRVRGVGPRPRPVR